MNRCAIFCLAIMLGQSAGSALAADKAFESNYAKARKNVTTPVGAAFDYKLGMAIQASPGFQKQFKACALRNPAKHAVHGYLSFSSTTSYAVVLEPRDAYSACLSTALTGRRVPPPPSLPYVNPFDLGGSPSGK